jgi:hypothetical protein
MMYIFAQLFLKVGFAPLFKKWIKKWISYLALQY